MSQIAALKIPTARAEQFRTLAHVRGLTITGLIEQIVRQAVKDGEIGPDLPGYAVVGHRGTRSSETAYSVLPTVEISLGQTQLPPLDLTMSGLLTSTLTRLATTRGRDAVFELPLTEHARLTVARKGTGLILAVKASGLNETVTSALSFSMALDLVGMIQRASAEAVGLSIEEFIEFEAIGG